MLLAPANLKKLKQLYKIVLQPFFISLLGIQITIPESPIYSEKKIKQMKSTIPESPIYSEKKIKQTQYSKNSEQKASFLAPKLMTLFNIFMTIDCTNKRSDNSYCLGSGSGKLIRIPTDLNPQDC